MTPIEMIEQARQAVQDGKLSWQDYYALLLALAVDPKLETITAARVDGEALSKKGDRPHVQMSEL